MTPVPDGETEWTVMPFTGMRKLVQEQERLPGASWGSGETVSERQESLSVPLRR